MGKEVEDKKFEDLLADRRHKEIRGTLKVIANAINDKKDVGISEAIKESVKATAALVQAIKDIPIPQTPEVNIEFKAAEIVSSLQGICNQILESNNMVIMALHSRPVLQEFQIERDGWNNLKIVKAVYKRVTDG